MELSRRGALAALAGAGAVGAVGFVGASGVDDGEQVADGEQDGGGSGPAGAQGDEGAERRYVDVDPNAPFVATLEGDGARSLFDAGDLAHVEGVYEEGEDHLVVVELSEAGREAVRDALGESGAVDDPGPFEISMLLDGEEVRRVDLNEARADALAAESWDGVVTIPFGERSVAERVYGALAAE